MPYYRRQNYRGRRRVSRRKRPSRYSVYKAAGSQLYKDVQKLKNMINVEYKFHDQSSLNNLTVTPVIQAINLVNEGDTDQTHDGAMFRMKSVQINGTVRNLAVSGSNPLKVRMALVLDCDSAAATTAPTYADIYDGTGSIENRLRNLDNRSRFIILKEWEWMTQADGTKGYKIDYYRPLDHKVQIVGTATETNLRKNGLYVVMVSQNDTANLIELDWTSRIRYIDN